MRLQLATKNQSREQSGLKKMMYAVHLLLSQQNDVCLMLSELLSVLRMLLVTWLGDSKGIRPRKVCYRNYVDLVDLDRDC